LRGLAGACGGLAGARLTLAGAWKGIENLSKILTALTAAGMHAQVLLQSTARHDEIDPFDDAVQKTEDCRDWKMFKLRCCAGGVGEVLGGLRDGRGRAEACVWTRESRRSDGWVKCSTACWYGITASFNKHEMLAAVTAALLGKGVLSVIISRVPEVIDEPILQHFLPPETFMRVRIPWPTCRW
jgi:hypothetical protein